MNIKRTLIIASMTVEENLRKRIQYILLFLSVVLVAASAMLNTFSLGAQVTIIKDLSLSGIGLFGLLFTISLLLNAVPGEIEHRTIYPLLAQPITKADYLWGKFLGTMALVTVNLLVLALELMLVLYPYEHAIDFAILPAVLLIAVQCGIVGAMVIFFSLLVSYPLTISIVLFLFIVGGLSTDYIGLLFKETPKLLAKMVLLIKLILPKFDFFIIKNAVVHNHAVSANFVWWTVIYGFVYIAAIMLVSEIVFERRDL